MKRLAEISVGNHLSFEIGSFNDSKTLVIRAFDGHKECKSAITFRNDQTLSESIMMIVSALKEIDIHMGKK